MDDKSDIDKIFADGFSEEQFPYNPASWDAMSDMLDKDDKRGRWWLWLRWSLLLLVAIGSGIALMLNASGEDVAVGASLGRVVEQPTDEVVAGIQDTDVDQIPTSTVQEMIDTPVDGLSRRLATEKLDNAAVERSKNAASVLSVASNSTDTYEGSDSGESIGVSQQISIALATDEVSGTSRTVDNSPALAISDQANVQGMDRDEVVDQLPSLASIINVEIVDLEAPAYAALPEVRPQARTKKWEVELTGGAELSVLGMESTPKLGNRGGVRIGYYLSRQWSVHAGLVYSNKLFAGSGDEFQDRSIFTDVAPEKMEGKSAFLEIPVSVRYHWSSAKRMGHFVEAGFTNFNHRSEWYGFEYNPEDEAPDLMKEIPSRSVNKMALGAFRLAYGLDIGLGASTSIGVVPYIQVPLRGIGAGNVSIYNTGLELALRHRL